MESLIIPADDKDTEYMVDTSNDNEDDLTKIYLLNIKIPHDFDFLFEIRDKDYKSKINTELDIRITYFKKKHGLKVGRFVAEMVSKVNRTHKDTFFGDFKNDEIHGDVLLKVSLGDNYTFFSLYCHRGKLKEMGPYLGDVNVLREIDHIWSTDTYAWPYVKD